MLPSHLHSPRLTLPIALVFATISPLTAQVRAAQSPAITQSPPAPPKVDTAASQTLPPSTLPKDYVIGVEDILSVVFWTAKELSAEVIVRPDGKISLPLLNDVAAVGMTPEQLAAEIAKIAAKFVKDPGATVIVREIRSRKVYVVGEVVKPGSFALGSEMTVLQAIGEAGGFMEGAKKGDVVIVRQENGKERRLKFNYTDFVKGKNIQQNIRLLPGDTILVR